MWMLKMWLGGGHTFGRLWAIRRAVGNLNIANPTFTWLKKQLPLEFELSSVLDLFALISCQLAGRSLAKSTKETDLENDPVDAIVETTFKSLASCQDGYPRSFSGGSARDATDETE